MLSNRSIPDVTIIPELHYADLGAAVEWLCDVLGFRERLRIAGHRVQLTFGDGAIVAVQGDGDAAGADHRLMVRVEDVDEHFARVRDAGGSVVRAPETYPFGERQYAVVDPGGHAWVFTQSVADVDPAEWGGELVGE